MKRSNGIAGILLATGFLVQSTHAHQGDEGMTGVYKVLKADCADHGGRFSRIATGTFFVGKLAQVDASLSQMEVYGQDAYILDAYNIVFKFEVGPKRVNCLTDDCFALYTGTYSRDRIRFRMRGEFANHPNSELQRIGDINFTLTGDLLKISNGINGGSECVLKKIVN